MRQPGTKSIVVESSKQVSTSLKQGRENNQGFSRTGLRVSLRCILALLSCLLPRSKQDSAPLTRSYIRQVYVTTNSCFCGWLIRLPAHYSVLQLPNPPCSLRIYIRITLFHASYQVTRLVSTRTRLALLETFASLDQRVLWKWDQDTMADLPPNVRLAKWLPQQDILGESYVSRYCTFGGP